MYVQAEQCLARSYGVLTLVFNLLVVAAAGVLEFPVFVDGSDSPFELLAERLREESLDRDVELLAEDNRQTRVNVVLQNMSVTSWVVYQS